jgi:hypothetical protein
MALTERLVVLSTRPSDSIYTKCGSDTYSLTTILAAPVFLYREARNISSIDGEA